MAELQPQVLGQVPRLQRAAAGDGIDGLPAAVARHQDAIEFTRDAAPACLTAALARLAVELA